MIAIDLLAWWYTTECARVGRLIGARSRGVLDSFSVGLLSRTLFAPFRQIDAGSVRGPLEVQLQAWGGRMFSRGFGFVVRSLFISAGVVCAGGIALVSSLQFLLWLCLPIAPLIGLVLMVTGWMPWSN